MQFSYLTFQNFSIRLEGFSDFRKKLQHKIKLHKGGVFVNLILC